MISSKTLTKSICCLKGISLSSPFLVFNTQVAPQIRANPFTLSHSKPIGPLPEDEKGNKYLIAIIDIFSRFLELYPAVDATALSAADAILQHTGQYGTHRY